MRNELKYPEVTTYWIAYDEINYIYIAGKTEPEQVTTSGQPFFEFFTDERAWYDRRGELLIPEELL